MALLSKNNAKSIVIGLLLCLLSSHLLAQQQDTVPTRTLLNAGTDTLLPAIRPLQTLQTPDSLQLDTSAIRLSKDALDAPVQYQAADSIVMDMQTQKIYLFNKARTTYKNYALKADRINLNQHTSIVTAYYVLDSLGQPHEPPVFKDGEQTFLSDTIKYDFKTKKGIIFNTTTQQGEGFLHSEKSKIVNNNTVFGANGWYTTCDLDTPHFAIHIGQAKVIANKLIVARNAELEFEGVPTPLYLPFFIFPLSTGQRTGLLPPAYTVTQQKGIGLTGLGYYLGLGPYFDMTIRGDVYSYGSWDITINPTYRKRYRYSGSLNLSIANTRFGDPKTPDFQHSKDFRIMWSHSIDPKAHPGINFSASVNAGTSTYNLYNVTDPAIRLNNTLNSSIAFSKTWQGSPFNLTLSASHSQNTSTRQVNIAFPQLTFTMNTIYPFQSRNFSGIPKWYQKIGIGYNMQASNSVSFVDTEFLKPSFFKKFQSGIQHSIPISLSLPAFKYFTFSPSIGLSQTFYTRKMFLHFNPKLNRLDSTYQYGFFPTTQLTTGASFSTRLYGLVQFKHGKIRAIRHVLTPTIGVSYQPDLGSKYYYMVQVDTSGYKQQVSVFDGSIYGPPAYGRFGGLNFGINNNLEMKVFSKKDTVNHEKKVQLLNTFSINSAYNFYADSLKLSPISLSASTTLFDKINLSASGVIDPYVQDSTGRDINRYVWQTGRYTIGKLRSGNIALSTSFRSQANEKKSSSETTQENATPEVTTLQQEQEMLARPRNFADMVDFSIPWSLNLSYSLSFNRTRTPDYKRDTTIFNQSLIFSGDFNLTPKWKVSISSGFDFRLKQLTYTTINLTRDLHCWRMNISIIPYGFYKSFSITINPVAGVLHDLKFNRTRQFYDLFQ